MRVKLKVKVLKAWKIHVPDTILETLSSHDDDNDGNGDNDYDNANEDSSDNNGTMDGDDNDSSVGIEDGASNCASDGEDADHEPVNTTPLMNEVRLARNKGNYQLISCL